MKGKFVVAQMEGHADSAYNYQRAVIAVQRAKEEFQADLILFPETFLAYVTSKTDQEERVQLAQTLDGDFVTQMKALALKNQIWIVFGMREAAGKKNYNTTVVIDSSGEIVSTYHKTHLYDAFSTKESDEFLSGDQLFSPVKTPFGTFGLFVCYEARFPEIARRQALLGADVILMPTAWVKGKRKEEQLRILACARALENTVYLLASNLCGGECTGHSMIVDPLGEVLSEADIDESLLYIEIDTDRIKSIRESLPSLKNRRPDLYN